MDKKNFKVDVVLASRAFDSVVLTDGEICEMIQEAIWEKFASTSISDFPVFVESNCTPSEENFQ